MAKFPSHTKEIHRINRIIGQLEGIRRMIEEERYCPEILIQTKAVTSSINSLEMTVLEKHIQCCVKKSLEHGNDVDDKVDELVDIFRKRIK